VNLETATETLTPGEVERAIDQLVDEWRVEALWYLRPDYYPLTDSERRRVLEAIQERSNLEVFKRAARLKAWLCPHSSATSASP
jgi:DNA-binding PadR family transcriptional regulator